MKPTRGRHKRSEIGPKELAVRFARAADEKKAENIVVLDLRGKSPVTDVFVLATANNPRQRRAVTEAIAGAAKEIGARILGSEGEGDARWVLLDYVDVIVHVFDREWRELYDLELLWGDAERIAWQEDAEEA